MIRHETYMMDDGVTATSDGRDWLLSRGEKFLGRLRVQPTGVSLPVFMLGLIAGALLSHVLK